MEVKEVDWLAHLGTPQQYDFDPHGSGRYRQGSGEEPYQHAREFKDRVNAIRKKHKEETGNYASYRELTIYMFGTKVNEKGETVPVVPDREFRKMITRSDAEIDAHDYLKAHKLQTEKGYSVSAIAKEIGRSESGTRQLLARDANAKQKRIDTAAELIKESLDKRGGFIDIGAGSELSMGVSRTTFEAAVAKLVDEGPYAIQQTSVKQLFGQGNTTIKALCPGPTTKGELFRGISELHTPIDIHVDKDGERVVLRPVESVDSKRVMVNYAEDGGKQKDGVIELRRGVADLDMGNSSYAQVRICVDGTHYLKGMAVYADDLPDGIDIRFNTNKHRGTPMISEEPGGKEVLKPIKYPDKPENPFGASVSRQNGALNIVNEEGDWNNWSRTLASQFLSKQYDATAKRQLKATAEVAKAEFEEISSLTNPTLKRFLLNEFSNGCDADAVHLKAVRLPGQAQKVLLPLPDNKPTECYCPTLADGTQVALVRYPHGGVFEIPVLKVNNNNPEAKKIFGNARDAIGIHPSQAEVLSGADFDGDTVMVLPLTGAFKLKQMKPLEDLKDFDPKVQFNGDHLSAKDLMKKANVQRQMGEISNLITDMTIGGADEHELARAVAHSMVVIDANKHKLDYKASAKYFRIAELKKKYQTGGASTLISKAKSQYWYDDRREKAPSKLTPEERERWLLGEKIYENTGKTRYFRKEDKVEKVRHRGTQMGEAKDAYELSSGSSMESYFADYANEMKALGNKARAEMRSTGKLEYSPSAKVAYAEEVSSLKSKLNIALMNAPLERKAQALANSTWLMEKREHPEYTKEEEKKAKSRALLAARGAVGAGKKHIDITDREWEAIQAGAIHDNMLLKILSNTDSKALRVRAMPKGREIDPAKIARAKALRNTGDYSWADLSDILGVSVSALQNALE